jgi:hypothetical protein
VFDASGATLADILTEVTAFRNFLGTNNGVGGTFGNGRREINWDAVPDAFSAPNLLPANFFNKQLAARGRIFHSRNRVSGERQQYQPNKHSQTWEYLFCLRRKVWVKIPPQKTYDASYLSITAPDSSKTNDRWCFPAHSISIDTTLCITRTIFAN